MVDCSCLLGHTLASNVHFQPQGHKCSSATGTGVIPGEVDMLAPSPAPGSDADIFSLMYSSGTSGDPKGLVTFCPQLDDAARQPIIASLLYAGIVVTKARWLLDAQAGGVGVMDPRAACSYMALAHGACSGGVPSVSILFDCVLRPALPQ